MIILCEPEKFSPIELVFLAQRTDPSLSYSKLCIAFGIEENTLARWMCGKRNPDQPYWIIAAQLRKAWNL